MESNKKIIINKMFATFVRINMILEVSSGSVRDNLDKAKTSFTLFLEDFNIDFSTIFIRDYSLIGDDCYQQLEFISNDISGYVKILGTYEDLVDTYMYVQFALNHLLAEGSTAKRILDRR